MLVFIGGMPRSGSTYSFNIVRELLERRGSVFQEAGLSVAEALGRCGDVDHVIVKGHIVDEPTAEMIDRGDVKSVCTVRKIEDAIASWIETFGFSFEIALNDMHNWLRMFYRIRDKSLVLRYDRIENEYFGLIKEIAEYLDIEDPKTDDIAGMQLKYSKDNIKRMVDMLSIDDPAVVNLGFSYYDTKTFFHRRHVSSLENRSAAMRIGADMVLAIRREFANCIDDEGELLDEVLRPNYS